MIKRPYDYEHLIDDKPLLEPDADINVTCTDLEGDSERDEAGFMHRIVIRHNLHTWHFTYAVLTDDEYRYLISLYQNKSSFSFTFRDKDGQAETVQAYCSETSISYYNRRLGLYKNLKFEIIEC